jgi:hypothetical protein
MSAQPVLAEKQNEQIRVPVYLPKVGDEQWFLLRSDAHHDSAQADNALEKRHLDEAVERDAYILDFGDLFDAMQGPHDKRRSQDGQKPEHKKPGYFNQILYDAEDFYAPYASRFLLLSRGNHENSVISHTDFDLTDGLARSLNKRGGNVQVTGYDGWVRFCVTMRKTVKASILMYYTHGNGGDSPVTDGVILAKRRAVFLPDADIVVSGHIHKFWDKPVPRDHISPDGIVTTRFQLHVQLPSYKKHGAWEKSKGFAPALLGAYWLRIWGEKDGVKFDVQRAM